MPQLSPMIWMVFCFIVVVFVVMAMMMLGGFVFFNISESEQDLKKILMEW